MRQRFGVTECWRTLFGDIDAILCPATPTPAFPHDHSPMDDRTLDIDGRAVSYGDQIVWATIAILNGLPATTCSLSHGQSSSPSSRRPSCVRAAGGHGSIWS
jgi:amidase